MAKRGTKAGDFYVEGHASTEQMEADLRDARTTVERETQAMGDAADRNVGGGFRRVGERISTATEGVRKFSSSITETVGIATGLLGVFASIVGIVALIRTGITKVREQIERMGELSPGVADALAKQAESVERIRDAITPAEAGLEDRLVEIEEARRRAIRDITASIGPGGASAKFIADQVEKTNRLYDEQRAKVKQQLADLRDRLNAEAQVTEEVEAQVEATGELIADVEALRYRLDRFVADINTALDRSQEQAEDRAQAMADAISKAMTRALSGSSFNQDIAGPIEEMTRRIETKLDQLKHGGRF